MASSEIRLFRRIAQFNLRKWRFYEKNIVAIQSEELLYRNAIAFFQGLKQMEKGEIELLAQRWYLSEERHIFISDYGDYMSVKPVNYPTISERTEIGIEILPSLYGKSEIKLGKFILEHKE